MFEITIFGLDLAKNVFQVHGTDASGRAVLRKKLRRDQVIAFLGICNRVLRLMNHAAMPPFRGCEISKLGHKVRLPPALEHKPSALITRQLASG